MDDQMPRRPVPSEANGAARLRRVEGGRQHVIKVKLDDAEYTTITERATALKLSIQRFLVSRAAAPRSPASTPDIPGVRAPLIAELTGLRRLTANLANNINQIARALNSGGTPAGSIPATADAVRRTMSRLDSVLATLAPDPPGTPASRSVPPESARRTAPVSRGMHRPASLPTRIVPEAPP